jgi:hypothetical protein
MGELVETRSEALSHQVAFGVAIVLGGILMHYLVARGLAAWRGKSRAQQTMIDWAHILQMASPLSLQKSAIVLWSGTSPPISPSALPENHMFAPQRCNSDRIGCDDDRHRSLDVSS